MHRRLHLQGPLRARDGLPDAVRAEEHGGHRTAERAVPGEQRGHDGADGAGSVKKKSGIVRSTGRGGGERIRRGRSV